MSDIQLFHYKIAENRLYVTIESQEEFEYNFKLQQEDTKESQIVRAQFVQQGGRTVASFSLSEVEFTSPQGRLELSLIGKYGVVKRLVMENLPLKDNYSSTSFRVDEVKSAVPYISPKGALTLHYGNIVEILAPYVTTFDSKVTAQQLAFQGTELSLIIPAAAVHVLDQLYITLVDRKGKEATIVAHSIVRADADHIHLLVQLDQAWVLDHRYDLYIQEVSGNKLRRTRVGIIDLEVKKGENKYFDSILIHSGLKLLPYITTNGELSFFAGDAVSVEKARGVSIVRHTFHYNELAIELDNRLRLQLRDIPAIVEQESIKTSFLLKLDNKEVYRELSSEAVIIDKDGSLSLRLDRIFADPESFDQNERWLLVLQLHLPGRAALVADTEEALEEVSAASEDTESTWMMDGTDDESIIICNFVKHANWRQEAFKRYRRPMVTASGISVIPYESEHNVLTFLLGDDESYNNQIYTKISTLVDIENLEVRSADIRFQVVDQSLLNGSTRFLFRDRKSKDEWTIPYTVLTDRTILLDISEFVKLYSDIESRWDTYIQTQYADVNEEGKLGLYSERVREPYKRYFPPFTKMGAASENDDKSNEADQNDDTEAAVNVTAAYLTVKNELSIVIRPALALFNEKLKTGIAITKFSMVNGEVSLEVRLEVKECNAYRVDRLLFKLRNKASVIEHDIRSTETKVGENVSLITAKFHLKDFTYIPFYWDLFAVLNLEGEEVLVKLKNLPRETADQISTDILGYEYQIDDRFMIYPYVTGDRALSFCFRERASYETRYYKVMEKAAYVVYRLFRRQLDKRNIWLGYEKNASTAQDNGYYFFDYCMTNKKHDHFYYVIKEGTADYNDLQQHRSRVLKFMSFKYMVYMYAAKLLVSSESKGHSYDIRIQKGKLKQALDKKKFVFLQHGVTALKRVDYVFKKTKNSAVDLFVVTSDYEKKIVRDYFGYDDKEIIVTGFCRWDALRNKATADYNEIFIMPTWRSWMDGILEDAFVQTDYYQNYVAFLQSERLKHLLSEHGIKAHFLLHPKFIEHIDKFKEEGSPINILQFGDVKINEMLMRSSLLITDYSSVAWEMYYQQKPTLFFQFDADKYQKYQGSYLDMDNELFGDRAFTVDELLSQIEYYIERDFREDDKYAQMRSKYFKYVDTNNSERTFDEIQRNAARLFPNAKKVDAQKGRQSLYEKLRKSTLAKKLWRRATQNTVTKRVVVKLRNVVRGK